MLPLIQRSVAVAARQQQKEQWIRAMAGTGSGTKGSAPGAAYRKHSEADGHKRAPTDYSHMTMPWISLWS